jgi:hypothetical protein
LEAAAASYFVKPGAPRLQLDRHRDLDHVALDAWDRYFRVHLEQDLSHQWLLTQVNGRSGSRLGRHRATPAASIEDALFHLAAIAKRRRQRSYQLMSLNGNSKEIPHGTVS